MNTKGGEWKVESWMTLILMVVAFHFPLSSLHAQCGVAVKPRDMKTYNESLEKYQKRHYREAAQLMRRVAQRNPKAADPQFWLGMMAVDNGFNTVGIRRYFPRCLELCPAYPDPLVHYYMGMIYYTDERYEEAAAEMEAYFEMANGSENPAHTKVYEEASAYLHWSRFLADAELNKAPFEPWVLKGVSTKHNESLPYITLDGNACYYLRQVPEKQEYSFYIKTEEKKEWKLFCSNLKDSVFSAGAPLPAPFNQGAPEGSVTLTADGNTLFFSRITPNGRYSNSDIYYTRRVDGKWQPVKGAGSNVNTPTTWESQPSVSADGRWLYFASNRQGGQGGTDIWRCHRLKNGDWSRPENLGPKVNTPGNEKFPFIHADGHTLYFVSDGWQGFGGYDIYFTDIRGTDAFPTNLGLPINTEGNELSFGVTLDGTRAYIPGRVAESRSTDILMFDLYPAARPEAMRLCRVRVVTPTRSTDTLLVLSEREDNTVTFADTALLPVVVCGKGRAFDGMTVALADSVAPLHVSFLAGSRLSPAGESVLRAWTAWLLEHPRVHLAVECPKATEAKAVYDFLVKQGLRPERLSHRGGTDVSARQLRLQ